MTVNFGMRFFSLIVLSIVSMLVALSFGAADISVSELSACLLGQCDNSITESVLWQIRLPRVLVGFVAGVGLAAAGAILQNTTRNPLADPYLFGIVAGAGLGAMLANLSFAEQYAIALPVAAFSGALFAVMLVLLIGRSIRQVEHLLLVGVAVSFLLSAVGQFLLFMADPFASNRVIFWLMGSLARVEMDNFWFIAPVVAISLIVVIGFSRQLDALLLGDETAHTLGVNVSRVRMLMLAICAALTASIVAYCGGIGFVGLMVPHIARHWFGVTTKRLLLGSALLGGCFLVWVDVAARSLLSEQEIPIGVITAGFGSLFFLYILKSRHN